MASLLYTCIRIYFLRNGFPCILLFIGIILKLIASIETHQMPKFTLTYDKCPLPIKHDIARLSQKLLRVVLYETYNYWYGTNLFNDIKVILTPIYIDITVYSKIMYILYETGARQQKVALPEPAFAVTLPAFKSMYHFSQGYFHMYVHVYSLSTGIPRSLLNE